MSRRRRRKHDGSRAAEEGEERKASGLFTCNVRNSILQSLYTGMSLYTSVSVE